jgi:hypothetical protein
MNNVKNIGWVLTITTKKTITITKITTKITTVLKDKSGASLEQCQ